MNLRTHDPIVWVGFPHPDPNLGRASVRVLIPPAFWRRILHHLHVQDAAWARWLTPQGVVQLRDALECDQTPSSGMAVPAMRDHSTIAPGIMGETPAPQMPVPQMPGHPIRMNPHTLPFRVMNVIQDTLRSSFLNPLVVQIKAAGPSAGGYYLMILTSGATAVFRARPRRSFRPPA